MRTSTRPLSRVTAKIAMIVPIPRGTPISPVWSAEKPSRVCWKMTISGIVANATRPTAQLTRQPIAKLRSANRLGRMKVLRAVNMCTAVSHRPRPRIAA